MTSMRSNATVPTPIHSGSHCEVPAGTPRQRHGDPTVQDGEHDVRDDQYGSPTAAVRCTLTDVSRPVGLRIAGPAMPSATETVSSASDTSPVIRINSPGHATACFQRPVVNVWSRETKRASIPCRVIHAGPRSPRITPAVAAAFASAAVAATAVTLHPAVCAG